MSQSPSEIPRTARIGDLQVHRIGLGTNRLTGPGVLGEPRDPEAAIALLRRVVELGVDLIDTADSYGPFVAERLIREALHTGGADPYGHVRIATKAGMVRTGPDSWHALGRPDYLRSCVEWSLQRLDVERLDLLHLHRIDPNVALEDQLGELATLQAEGKVRHVGLSQVTVDQLVEARRHLEVVSVQNRLSLVDRSSLDVLEHCEREGLAFLPWFPLGAGRLATAPPPRLSGVAPNVAASTVALAWLLALSPRVVPIPGTTSTTHLEENLAALDVRLGSRARQQLEEWAEALAIDVAPPAAAGDGRVPEVVAGRPG